MVGAYDNLTEELQQVRLHLKDELVFTPQRYGDAFYFHIEIPSESRFFRVNFEEYSFMSLLDGKTSFAHALAVNAQAFPKTALSEKQGIQFIKWLLENGIAGIVDSATPTIFQSSNTTKASWLQKWNPFWIKIPLGNPEPILMRIQQSCQWLFHPIVLVCLTIVIILGLAVGVFNFSQMYATSSRILAVDNWFSLLLVWVFLKMGHELAHGIVCRKFGGSVREAGVILILFAPLAFVDVTSSWRFKSRWQRIAVAGAGIYFELLVAAICIFVWFSTSSAIVKQQLVNIIAMAGISTIVFNANPLMRFDGYFILSDLLKIPNLYATGSRIVKQQVRWLFFGQGHSKTSIEIRNRAWVISIYGYCAVLWKAMISVGLMIAASVMFGGFGILLSIFGFVCWYGQPVIHLAKEIWLRKNTKPHSFFRAAVVSTFFVFIALTCWYVIPTPFHARCPCLVDFEDAAKIRSGSSGFVAEVLVADGQLVEPGTPLLRLTNVELQSEFDELAAKLKQHSTREKIALNEQNSAEAQNAARDFHAAEQAFNKCKEELQQLLIRAPHSGRVIATNLNQLVGRYFESGSHLLTIGNEETKEVVITIPSGRFRSADELLGKTVPVEFGTRRRRLVTIRQVDPKASRRVRAPKLIVPNGGALPVRPLNAPSENRKFELVSPHFQVFAQLADDDAKSLAAGERGICVLCPKSQTLGQFAFQTVKNWINTQLSSAKSKSK